MSQQTIELGKDDFLSQHFTLSPLPAVVQKVLSALQSGGAHASAIADLLSADAALVAQILKIVNSAYYALPRRISEVKHAVAYLGLAEIERVALTATVMEYFAPHDAKEFEKFWHHSFFTSLISKVLAKKAGPAIETEELHTAALLHDVGKLVLMKFYPEQHAVLSRHCRSNDCQFGDAERHFGVPSHRDFGRRLCQRWLLPESVATACELHEMDQLDAIERLDRYRDETRLVCLANMLANVADSELGSENKEKLQKAIAAQMGLGPEAFLLLMGEVYGLKAEVESFLSQL